MYYALHSHRLRLVLVVTLALTTTRLLFNLPLKVAETADRSALMHDLIASYDYDYDAIFHSSGTHESYTDRRLFEFNTFGNYTSPDVLNNGCRLTVVVVDPRPPSSAYNHPIWYTLESVASYAPYACVVIKTASCQVIYQGYNDVSKLPTNQQEVAMVAKAMYERSLPLFRRMMESGQVRINILNINKYGLTQCDNFGNGNSIFMNIHFWNDEFIEGIDSDMILTVQSDSVLCQHFEIDLWKHFDYVGAPWILALGEGCDSFRSSWRIWAPLCNGLTDYQLNEGMSQICTEGHGGIQGNGGLSIRNKNWMREAIQRCPTPSSGLENFASFDYRNEDVYFTKILNGLNATMPSGFEASLFSVESLFPEQTYEYVNLDQSQVAETINRLWGNTTGLQSYDKMHRVDSYYENTSAIESVPELRTIPLGFHKPWLYHAKDILQGIQIQKECKFLKFIFD
ncbi:hypothetical protein ACHAWU_001388 [Discostella pseudostelligera]|uniref:DUF5672 domain-containing protein n=1 Tax=Discostella pseudostelligera TaxID=259834 RepID=A0ABD3M1Y7_9STRA